MPEGVDIRKLFEECITKFESKWLNQTPEKTPKQEAKLEVQFLEERPPSTTQITDKKLELIRKAKKSIKIIQPYI